MGCDIHAMIERRATSPCGTYHQWVNAGDPDLDRWYDVFAALGVRHRGAKVAPVAPPRGIPGSDDDIACSAMRSWYEDWASDAHSASYLTLAEMKAYKMPPDLIDEEYGKWDPASTDVWVGLLREMERVKRDGDTDDDVRLVFFFDN